MNKFLSLLYHRGLTGEKLELIVCDGDAGLLNALELVCPEVSVQRCWRHKVRNVLDKVKREDRCSTIPTRTNSLINLLTQNS